MAERPPLKMDQPYDQGEPLDMDDARRAASALAQRRRDVEDDLKTQAGEVVRCENIYRKQVSIAMVQLRAGGMAATVVKDHARAEKAVMDALVEWRAAEGVHESIDQRLRGLEGERAMLRMLTEWSAKINLQEREWQHTQAGQGLQDGQS